MNPAALSKENLMSHDPQCSKSAGQLRFLCPLCGHDKPKDNAHRSLAVNAVTGAWLCHRCGERGLLVEYRTTKQIRTSRTPTGSRMKTTPFALSPERQKQTESDAGADERLRGQLKSVSSTLDGTPAGDYLKKRGIHPREAALCKARYSPTWGASENSPGNPSVVFPICDEGGGLIAAAGRSIDGDVKLTYGRKRLGVYVVPAVWHYDTVAVAEAPIDSLSLMVCGIPSLALVGTSWPDWLVRRLAFRTVLIATDADEAGDAAAHKLAAELDPFARCYRLRPPCKDWNEFLMESGREELKALLGDSLRQQGLPWPAMQNIER